jgi:3-(3-hydroxy-phenyl)propionate hydroxylase
VAGATDLKKAAETADEAVVDCRRRQSRPVPPTSTRRLCIADADEAASAIAVASRANDAVARDEIELYAARRERAAEYNLDAAGQALDYLQGNTPVTVLQKEVSASLADHFEPAGEYLDDAPYGPHEAPPIAATGNY